MKIYPKRSKSSIGFRFIWVSNRIIYTILDDNFYGNDKEWRMGLVYRAGKIKDKYSDQGVISKTGLLNALLNGSARKV